MQVQRSFQHIAGKRKTKSFLINVFFRFQSIEQFKNDNFLNITY